MREGEAPAAQASLPWQRLYLRPEPQGQGALRPACVDFSRTKTESIHANRIAERFHKTVLKALYGMQFRMSLYVSIEEPNETSTPGIS